MNEIIDKLDNRLKTLMGDIDFKWDERAVESPDAFMAIGRHNLRELKKFKAMAADRQERIWDLISNIFAVGLQAAAMEKYGNTDEESIREILCDDLKEDATQKDWHRLMCLAKQNLVESGITENRCQPIMEYFDDLPMAIVDIFVALTSPWRLLPANKAQSMALALTDLAKEVGV